MSRFNFLLGEVEKWQKQLGGEPIELRDPYPMPIYDESGVRIRVADGSKLNRMVIEAVRRAQLDPLYGISRKAAIRKHVPIVSREFGIPWHGDEGAKKKKRRKGKR